MMGTNYYLLTDVCPTCGRCKEKLHIGKSAMGWRFLFHAIEGRAETFEQWKQLISAPNTKIITEYNEEISAQQFLFFVEQKQTSKPLTTRKYDFEQGEFS